MDKVNRAGVDTNYSSHFAFHLGHGFEKVGDEAEVGDLEDGCLGVLVDGHDELRVLHAGQMLNRARNSYSDVEFLCETNTDFTEVI